jgi:hypothetical protein
VFAQVSGLFCDLERLFQVDSLHDRKRSGGAELEQDLDHREMGSTVCSRRCPGLPGRPPLLLAHGWVPVMIEVA